MQLLIVYLVGLVLHLCTFYLSGIQSNFTGRDDCKDLIRPKANEVNI